MMMESFILPANGKATPKSIERKRKMAEAMLQSGTDTSPVGHWTQGAARVAQALVGGYSQRKADQAEAEGQQSARDAMTKALMGGDKASMLEAMNNPFMDNASLQLVGDAWNRANQPPSPPELKDMGNGQFYQYDPQNPQGGQVFTPDGYQKPQGFRPATPEEKAAYGVPADAPLVFDGEGKPSILSGGGTNVNINNAPDGQPVMGTIPSGFVAVKDPSHPSGFRLVPAGGSQQEQEMNAAAEKQGIAQENKQKSADIVTEDIDRAITAIDESSWYNPVSGLGAGTMSSIGGTAAADMAGLLDTIEANVGFDKLAAMRASSPTGGALGSVTERELALLSSTLGSVKRSQSPSQLKFNLNRLWNVYQDTIHGPGEGPPRRELGSPQGGAPVSSGIDDLVNKYRSK